MSRTRWLLASLLLLLTGSAQGAVSSLIVDYQSSRAQPAAGATAAYSLNPACVEASAADGVVTLVGRNPGTATVMVVSSAGVEAWAVTVPVPAPVYPRGFEPPQPSGADSESGSVESRFTSDPGQWQNSLDLVRRQGEQTTRLRFSAVNYLGSLGQDQTRTALVNLSYQLLTPEWRLTLLDDQVTESPLTLDNTLLRGLHWRQGGWSLHFGYTTLTGFQNLLLPTAREEAAGIGYTSQLASSVTLTPAIYYFHDQASGWDDGSGTMGSLTLRVGGGPRWAWLTELGVSRGVGIASSLHWQPTENDRWEARVRYTPRRFAGLTVGNLRGVASDLDWQHQEDRLSSALSFSGNRYDLLAGQQVNTTASEQLRYGLSPAWSLQAGINAADFRSSGTNAISVGETSVQWPLGVNYQSAHWGWGTQYLCTLLTGGVRAGSGVRLSFYRAGEGWRVGGYFDRQSQALTLQGFLTQTPGLEQALERFGLTVSTPDQLSELMHDSSLLAQMGYVDGLRLNLSPLRLQAGADASWIERGGARQQLHFNFLFNRDAAVATSLDSFVATSAYSRRLGQNMDMFASFSLFRTNWLGTAAASMYPLVEVTLRRNFARTPHILLPDRNGTISGIVFEDTAVGARYVPGMPLLAGVEVILDHQQRTRSDAYGRYRFAGVSYGSHNVAVNFETSRPFYFTTPSRAMLDMDGRADFGVSYSLGTLLGQVSSDAGQAIAGVLATVRGPGGEFSLASSGDGFRRSGLVPGSYTVELQADSIPPGYVLAALAPQKVTVQAGEASRVSFILPAQRTIAGRVWWNASPRRPLSAARLAVPELGRTTTSDSQGYYLFRNLPPGTYSLVLLAPGPEQHRQVTLSAVPSSSTGNDFAVEPPTGDQQQGP